MRRRRATFDLLEWIADRPRTYAETIEIWKTSCPHLAIWDDAVSDGLVRVVREPGSEPRVRLTPAGGRLLARPSGRDMGPAAPR